MSVDTESAADGPGTDEKSEAQSDGQPLVVTESALETVLGIRSEEDDPETLALRVAITGSSGREYTYDLSFATEDEVAEGHLVYEKDGLRIAIESESVDRLDGAELDLPRNAAQGGLVIRNPNTPDPFEGIDIELTGELPEKVAQLLEQQVNPMLASHGGFAQFVGVDDDNNVYVTMGGGCQGCAASAATLRDGIRTAIMDAIPEVAEVIDTTDHAAGENPFYT
ncbi:MAG: NifU family protein [Microthrixaceae bacterium]